MLEKYTHNIFHCYIFMTSAPLQFEVTDKNGFFETKSCLFSSIFVLEHAGLKVFTIRTPSAPGNSC